LDGGADIIDVKEPNRGSLGMADSATIQDIVKLVAGRVPVSVALGEYRADPRIPDLNGVTWAKLGLRGLWRRTRNSKTLAPLLSFAEAIQPVGLVGVVYADDRRAFSPPFDVVLDWYQGFQIKGASPPGILIDTAVKDGKGLMCWKSLAALKQYQQRCRDAGFFLALAGSLRMDDIHLLVEYIQPDIIAVRGAACEGAERNGEISRRLVDQLRQAVRRQSLLSSE
jgi:uncharacterized protein (UPF0264 family)